MNRSSGLKLKVKEIPAGRKNRFCDTNDSEANMADGKIIFMELDQVRPYHDNPRNNDEGVDSVAESIKKFGFKQPIVVDKDHVIIAGHVRRKAAKKLGLEKVPVIIADDLTDEEVKAYRLADNKTGEFSGWNYALLKQELGAIQDIDMEGFGFEVEELLPPDLEDDLEEEPGLPEIPETSPGDLYQLGKHRLICGDATKKEDVAKLTDGNPIDLFITDPPYNVNYCETENVKKAKSREKSHVILNDKLANKDFEELLTLAFQQADQVMRPGAAFYIWHADSERGNVQKACDAVNWKVRQCLIWIKNQIVIGRQDYQWKHEPCLYGWKDGGGHYFTPDRTQATVREEEIDIESMTKAELAALARKLLDERDQRTTILRENKPTVSLLHPTMKPIPLIGKLIHNSTKKGWTVMDTFAGSGTTLIASEKLGRVSYSMELDPKYCDVIVKRWEDLTGEKAIKIR